MESDEDTHLTACLRYLHVAPLWPTAVAAPATTTPVEEQQLALRLTLLLVLASYISRSRDTATTMGALVEVLLQICKHFTSRDDFESPSSVQSVRQPSISNA